MIVYLACTVRGDRAAVAGIRSVAAALERAGHTVLTKHLLDDNVDAAESLLAEGDVYARDIAWLESCDILVAEASGSSYGVGFEVGYVLGRSWQTAQRVILLYRRDRRGAISRLIPGTQHPRCVHVEYDDATDLAPQVIKAMSHKP